MNTNIIRMNVCIKIYLNIRIYLYQNFDVLDLMLDVRFVIQQKVKTKAKQQRESNFSWYINLQQFEPVNNVVDVDGKMKAGTRAGRLNRSGAKRYKKFTLNTSTGSAIHNF